MFPAVNHDEGVRRKQLTSMVWKGLRMKDNLPIFKDKKTKDVVIYCSWWRDKAIFHHLGWDGQHLLPYVFSHCRGSQECR